MKVTLIMSAALAASVFVSGVAIADADKAHERILKYRQSVFAIVGNNMGALGAMAKGKAPWNNDVVAERAADLAAVANLNIMRGFPEDSDHGRTRAKPDIWLNSDDFAAKMDDFVKAANALNKVAASGDQGAIKKGIGALGKTCKSCHKEYKTKDFPN